MIDDNFLDNTVAARYQMKGIWKAITAIHPGGESDDFEANVDMALLRSRDGTYFVPGASIAGAARSYLAGAFVEQKSEPQELHALFGDDKFASLVTVFDAKALNAPKSCIRDGVRISPTSGIAQDAAKYNFEVLPAGTEFSFTFQLVVYKRNRQNVSEEAIRDRFLQMIDGFANGHIRLGAKTRRGLGKGKLEAIQIARLQMDDPNHVRAWLDREWKKGEIIQLKTSQRPHPKLLRIDATLKLKTSLLIRSAGHEPKAPEMVHLTENGKSLLSGTSLAGVLRQRCLRIANTMGLNGPETVRLMFGPAPEEEGQKYASRVRVEEQALQPGSGGLHVQGRVAIDRFTGGALESHLFDQAAFWPSQEPVHASIVIELEHSRRADQPEAEYSHENKDQCEVAILLQAFKDLWLGDLSLGGEAGAGRGIFTGVQATFSSPGIDSLTIAADPEVPIKVIQGDWTQWNRLASVSVSGGLND